MSGGANPLLTASFKHRLGDFVLDAELQLPSRGISGIFGDSGCGKTTLLRCLAGLERADSGAVAVMVRDGSRTRMPRSRRYFLSPMNARWGWCFRMPACSIT